MVRAADERRTPRRRSITITPALFEEHAQGGIARNKQVAAEYQI
jgi:hypothetical protein